MSDIRTAATAVILRPAKKVKNSNACNFEVLLMQRVNPKPDREGMWVFPGGVFELIDKVESLSEEATARKAAARETLEESQITLDPNSLQLISHWTTPATEKRRWATWFFLTDQAEGEVQADGEEMQRGDWFAPSEALEKHRENRMTLLPPTVVTLTELQNCKDIAAAKAFYAAREAPFIAPRMATEGVEQGVFCMLYPQDAAYEYLDAAVEGARNRCYLEHGAWRYEFIPE